MSTRSEELIEEFYRLSAELEQKQKRKKQQESIFEVHYSHCARNPSGMYAHWRAGGGGPGCPTDDNEDSYCYYSKRWFEYREEMTDIDKKSKKIIKKQRAIIKPLLFTSLSQLPLPLITIVFGYTSQDFIKESPKPST